MIETINEGGGDQHGEEENELEEVQDPEEKS